MEKKYIVPEGITERLDVWLADQTSLTRSQTQKFVKLNRVLVNGSLPKKNGDMIVEGDEITMLEKSETAIDEKINRADSPMFADIEVISETPEYIVLNKPAGLIVHPDANAVGVDEIRNSGTLAGWLLRKYPEIEGVGESPTRPGLVHRLDKDVSGLMVVARTQKSFEHLKDEFKNRRVIKKYYALAHGTLPTHHGFIDFLVARGPTGRIVARPNITHITLQNVASIQDGRAALTEFSVIREYINYTYCDITLHTGRTHQIRVHFFAYNHPLVGDPLYFNKKIKNNTDKKLGRVFLHSYHLEFTTISGESVKFEIPLPAALQNLLTQMKPV